MVDIAEYSNLTGMAFEAKEQVAPEDEFFHSVYISGQTRKNHIGITETSGKLQIRGVDYNLDEVYGIIIHIKSVLVYSVQKQGRESTECFSWCGQAPFKGTSGRLCGKNSAERASVAACKDCRSQIIVAFIRCNPDGTMFLGADKKPVFMFIRGKGTKYSNVSEYLNNLSKLDLDPIFPVTPENTKMEKTIVNHKRFITKITIGWTQTKFGNKSVYELEKVGELPKSQILSLLDAAKKTLGRFSEKFDWSLRTKTTTPQVPAESSFGDLGNSTSKEEPKADDKAQPANKSWSFDEVDF